MPDPIAALLRWKQRRSRLMAALVSSPVAFGLLIVALLAAGWNYLVAESSRERVAEANGVVLEVERLFSAIKDLETGERGFVLVGGENYLIPYDEARGAIDRGLARLRTITHGHLDAALAGGRTMEALVADKRDFAARVVALRKERGFEAATDLVRTGEGKRTMDAIRAEAAAIRAKLTERVDQIQRSDRLRGLLLAVLTGAAAWSAVLLLAGHLLLRRDETGLVGDWHERVVEAVPIGLGLLDQNGRLRNANRALFASTDWRAREPVWRNTPEVEHALSKSIRTALDEGLATEDISLAVPSRHGERHRLGIYPMCMLEGRSEARAVALMMFPEPPVRSSPHSHESDQAREEMDISRRS